MRGKEPCNQASLTLGTLAPSLLIWGVWSFPCTDVSVPPPGVSARCVTGSMTRPRAQCEAGPDMLSRSERHRPSSPALHHEAVSCASAAVTAPVFTGNPGEKPNPPSETQAQFRGFPRLSSAQGQIQRRRRSNRGLSPLNPDNLVS